jgi:alpha-galactosidase
MKLVFDRVETRCRRGAVTVDVENTDGIALSWALLNDGRTAAEVESVAAVWRLVDVREPVRMFRHGYQSWSPSGWATFGVDADPSRTPGAIPLVIDMHHADPAIAQPDELRSELVTVLDDGSTDPPLVVGFLGGTEHDGTFRLRHGAGGPQGLELWAEAYFGGAVVERGSARRLHSVESWQVDDDVRRPLDWWASAIGAAMGARAGAPYQVGWCSWYHYFQNVTQHALESNLALASTWPFEVFQLDDGFQPAIGDWLTTNDSFESSLDVLAARIADAGLVPGLWLAPFLAAPGSTVAGRNPGWLAGHASGRPLVGMVNDHWGGAVHTLDTTQTEVLDHLEQVARELVAAGFRYLKLDFTYAPGLDGHFADPSRTPAERVRAGFDAIRRGAGDDVFILGCGAPLGACIGAVDGMRIGPDVAPWWEFPAESWSPPGYKATSPATAHAVAATRSRQFMHRRLWLNDPDCVMLRTQETAMTPDEAYRWAAIVGESGGMTLVSDDLALLGTEERALLDEVIALGRANDTPFGD